MENSLRVGDRPVLSFVALPHALPKGLSVNARTSSSQSTYGSRRGEIAAALMKVSVVEREGQKLQLWRAAVAARGGWSASPLKARSTARKVRLNCLVSSDLASIWGASSR